MLLSACLLLGMMPWFSATAVAPALAREFELGSGAVAWLTMAVQLGFVLGTLTSALLMLPDRWPTHYVAALSAVAAALATVAVAFARTGGEAMLLRFVVGVALAGVYPPAIKLVAGWWRDRRGWAIGVMVGALTFGSAAPHLVRAAVPVELWREVVIIAAAACMISALLFALWVRPGPYQAPPVPFDVNAVGHVLRNRGVVLATGGYLGHMWELYAMWTAMGAFWAAMVVQRELPLAFGATLAFASIAIGALGCVGGGLLADRFGRARTTIWAMGASAACALLIGALVTSPLWVLVLVALVWGVAVIADSAQFSACVTESAPREYVGTAVTLQTCAGFLLTLITIRLIPIWVDWWGWSFAFAPLAIGPLLGITAMRAYGRSHEPGRG